MMPLPEKLARLIDSRRTSQSQLSRETGIAQPKISAMTSGKQRPYVDQAFLLARALGVSLDWLADDSQDELPTPDPLREQVLQLIDDIGLAEAKRRLLGIKEEEPIAAPTATGPRLIGDRLGPMVEPGPEPSAPQPRGQHERPQGADAPPRRKRVRDT